MIDALTSLRFIFALMVFGAYCYVVDVFFDVHGVKGGFVRVSFFFVLSSFIISCGYLEKFRERAISKRTFWVPRVAHVYPLHWLTLLFAVVAVLFTSGMYFTQEEAITSSFGVGGEISYSFYLIHLFVLLSYVKWQKEAGFHVAWYISVPVLLSVAVGLSLLSCRYFEKPMNRMVKSLLNK